MFGPFELNPTTDVLTKMIGALEGRVAAITKEEKWFVGQFDVAKEKFRKYLDISR